MASEHLKLMVLADSSGWLAINKPSGLIVERNPFESPTVEELVYDHLSLHRKNPYVGIVHRLDRVTSGTMIFAKKKDCLRRLNEQFANRKVRKIYLAITERIPDDKKGVLKHWHIKNQKDKRADVYDQKVKGSREVVLRFKVLNTIEGRAMLEIQPQSGKFHQIRAQLAAIGCPVLGDKKYGAAQDYPNLSAALHAWKLQFVDTDTGEWRMVEAPAPLTEDWKAFYASP